MASLTGQLTSWIAHQGAYAVFALMALDALLPAGGELIMLYAGALAAGSITGAHATLFGAQLADGAESYVVLALAGALGYLTGALIGWAIGAREAAPWSSATDAGFTSAPRPSAGLSVGSIATAPRRSSSAA
jgi:hypothetical protein